MEKVRSSALLDVAATLEWLGGVRLADHSAVETRARWLLLDTLACIASGFRAAEPMSYAGRLAAQMPGPVTWPGSRVGLNAVAAANVAPMAACWFEACEGSERAHGRPGLHAVPVAAALGVQRGATLGDVLEASIWGYEIGARAGEAMRIRAGLHVDGTWGALAAVAAAGRISELDNTLCLEALATAACQLQASLYAPVRVGMTARNTYAGHAATQSILFVDAVAAGIRAPLDVFEEAACQLGSGTVPAGGWPWCPPGEFLILQGYLKPYAGVRHAHYAVEAARRWHAAHGGRTGDIRALVLETYPEAAVYCGIRAPTLPLQAQFSQSYATAYALLRGDLGPEAYRTEALAHPELRRLESLIELRTDPIRQGRGATLWVAGDAGEETFVVDGVRGDAAMPFDEAAVRAKAMRYLAPPLAETDAHRLIEYVLNAPLAEPFLLNPGEEWR